jgi:hypothetical protein
MRKFITRSFALAAAVSGIAAASAVGTASLRGLLADDGSAGNPKRPVITLADDGSAGNPKRPVIALA